MLFGGFGNTWRDTEQTSFKTDYAVTFTKRVDEIQDPTRDEKFSEARLASDFQQKLNASNQIDSNFVFFLNVSDASDYRFDTINSFTSNKARSLLYASASSFSTKISPHSKKSASKMSTACRLARSLCVRRSSTRS